MITRERYERFRKLCRPTAIYCLQPLGGLTHCNDWLTFRMASLGKRVKLGLKASQLPSHYFDTDEGRADGWVPVDALTAKQLVNAFTHAVAIVWVNPDPDAHGHVAAGEPTPEGSSDARLFASAAGGHNLDLGPYSFTFGTDKDAHLLYYANRLESLEP